VVLQDVLPLELATRPAASNFRWVILGLAFLGTTINYVDRQVWNILGPFFLTRTRSRNRNGVFSGRRSRGRTRSGNSWRAG